MWKTLGAGGAGRFRGGGSVGVGGGALVDADEAVRVAGVVEDVRTNTFKVAKLFPDFDRGLVFTNAIDLRKENEKESD